MKEGEDNISDDDEVSFNKKRTREEKEAEDRVRLIVISLNFSSSYHLLNDWSTPSSVRKVEETIDAANAMCPRKVIYAHTNHAFVDGIRQSMEVSRHHLLVHYYYSPDWFAYAIALISNFLSNRITVTQTVETQCEMDEEMTVRKLPLESQGLLESYLPPPINRARHDMTWH